MYGYFSAEKGGFHDRVGHATSWIPEGEIRKRVSWTSLFDLLEYQVFKDNNVMVAIQNSACFT